MANRVRYRDVLWNIDSVASFAPPPTFPTTWCIAYYKFDETSGTNINDEVSTNDWTLSNAAFNSSGKINYWAIITGDNWYASFPYTTFGTIGTADFWISLWFYALQPESWHYPAVFLSFENAAWYIWPSMFFDPLNAIWWWNGMFVRVNGNNGQYITSPSGSSLYSSWTHIVFTRISWVCYVYYNASLVKQWNDSTNIPAPSSWCTFLFSRDSQYQNQPTNAKVDEVWLWKNTWLTQTNVDVLYNSWNGRQYWN